MAAMALMTACGAESDMRQQGNADLDAPLSLTASGETAPTMRAANGLYTAQTGFSGGEKVKVYMKKAGSTAKSATYDVGTPYVSGTLKMSDLALSSGETGLYYPTGASGSVSLYGVYPSTSTATHTVSYDQRGDDAYMASDLMYAKQTASWATLAERYTLKPNLPFQHQLVKLVVRVVKLPDVWQMQEVKMLNVKRQVAVSAIDESAMTLGAVASASDGSGDNLLMAGEETASTEAEVKEYVYACVFPAQTWGSSSKFTDFLTVKADGGTATYRLKKTFTAGKEYYLTINLNGIALGTTIDIEGWGDDSEKVVNPITKKGGTLHVGDVDDKEYQGTAWEPTPTVTSIKGVTTTTLTKGTHYDLVWLNNVNAGEATILVVGKTGTDYEGQIGLGTFNITKAPLTVKADDKTRKYDENNPTWTFTYTGFKNGETDAVLTTPPTGSTTATKTSNVGTYDITVSGGEAKNYTITTWTKGTLTINKKAATLTCSTTELSFGSSDAVDSKKTKTGVSCTDGTIEVTSSDTDKCTVSYSDGTITVTRKTEDAFSDVTITVSVTPTNTTNYTAPSDVTFTVSAALLDKTGTVEDDGDNIKVYTSATGGYKISKTDKHVGIEWKYNSSSWGTKDQWTDIFSALGGSGFSVLNSKASGVISGWESMSGVYWSCTENDTDSNNAWYFHTDGWGYTQKFRTYPYRTISTFSDDPEDTGE